MRKGKLILLLFILTVFVLVLFGCGGEKPQEDSEIVKAFKKLDQIDFRAQNIVADKEKSEQLVREVYTEPQLSEALEYLRQMRKEKVKLVLYETEYKDIQVLEKTDAEATLRVHALSRGTYYTTELPETKLGPLDHESKYEVTMKKVDGNWKIAGVTYLPLEKQTAEKSKTEKK